MNDYEQLIEMMFADGTLDQSVRQEIEGMNDLQKRLHIVKILDKGLGLFTKIEGIMDLGKMDYIKEVVKVLKDYVLIADVEKKKFGEVMTPLTLIKDMLSILPQDVWSNPELKWLDSCNGTGPYPIMVIYKLMNGLKDWEPDDEKRYNHIIKNMIYVGEIQPKNMFLYMNAVDPMNEYNLNIYTGSFLEKEFDDHMNNVWGIEKINISLGNPPYNQMIDMLFLQKSYKISDRVLYVHPSTWLLDEKGKQKKFTDTKELIKDSLESIELFNGNKIFGVQLFIPCVFTYVNKNKIDDDIKCIDKINDIELTYKNIYQINKYSDIEIYPNIKEKILKICEVDNLLNHKNKKNGDFFVNISQIRGHVNLNSDKEMLLNDFYTLITRDEMVSGCISKHIFFSFTTQKESENFIKYLKSDFCRFSLSIYKNNSQLDRGELKSIPWLDYSKEINEIDILKRLNISENEIDFIKSKIPSYYF